MFIFQRINGLSALCRVVEWTGRLHDADACPPGCTEEHNFCYVRVPPTHTTAPANRKHRRRLDVAVDLRQEFRARALEQLLGMTAAELADAWALLEPRE